MAHCNLLLKYIDLIYLFMYEFLVLGALSRTPMHGYMIAKVLGNIIGPFRHLQWGALYPVLNRLQTQGLVTAEELPDEDGRTKKVYFITEAGRVRLHEHLMDTESHIGTYDAVFPHKVTHFSTLTPDERVYLSRHYAVHAQQNLDHLERKLQDISRNPRLSPAQRDDFRTVLQHRIEHWNHEHAWAESLIELSQTAAKEPA
jgi:DNA-binding PadR family transcriptional regulator